MLKIKKIKVNKPVLLTKLIPNFITLLGLVIGVSSIRFALDSSWEPAIYCILIAGVFDGIDGRVARMLNATSPFGAELDSLCDFANFGIAPAILIYLWSFQQYEFKLLSWAAILLFILSMALRLARFNLTFHGITQKKYFATGIPAPSAALLALLPVMLDFEISTILEINIRAHTVLIDLYIIIVAILTASRLPTFLLNNILVKPENLSFMMILFGVIIINIIIYPWYSLPLIAIIYIALVPVCFFISRTSKYNS